MTAGARAADGFLLTSREGAGRAGATRYPLLTVTEPPSETLAIAPGSEAPEPLFSVVIPCLNQAGTLDGCLRGGNLPPRRHK